MLRVDIPAVCRCLLASGGSVSTVVHLCAQLFCTMLQAVALVLIFQEVGWTVFYLVWRWGDHIWGLASQAEGIWQCCTPLRVLALESQRSKGSLLGSQNWGRELNWNCFQHRYCCGESTALQVFFQIEFSSSTCKYFSYRHKQTIGELKFNENCLFNSKVLYLFVFIIQQVIQSSRAFRCSQWL